MIVMHLRSDKGLRKTVITAVCLTFHSVNTASLEYDHSTIDE